MTITISLTPDLERKLRDKAAAAGVPAETFVVGTLAERLNEQDQAGLRTTPDASDESELLALINRGPSEETWQRYHALVASRRAETLTANEQQELRELTDTIELVNSQRMAALSRLAVLRGISLDEVMDQLGIRDPGHLDS